MLRSFLAAVAMAALLGGQVLIGLWLTRTEIVAQTALTVLLFTTIAVGIEVQVFVDRLAGLWDRLAFWRSPGLRADRAALRDTEAALPLRSTGPLDELDEETFARLTRRALGHYGDLSKLVASPLTALPAIDERLAARARPMRRWNAPTSSRPCWPTGSQPSSRATVASSAPPNSGATTTPCTSPTSWACGLTRRTPPPLGSIPPPGRRGSGWSPRCRSVRCTTGRTPVRG